MGDQNKRRPGRESECAHILLSGQAFTVHFSLDVLMCQRRKTQRFSGFIMLSELRSEATGPQLASFPGISSQITEGQGNDSLAYW